MNTPLISTAHDADIFVWVCVIVRVIVRDIFVWVCVCVIVRDELDHVCFCNRLLITSFNNFTLYNCTWLWLSNDTMAKTAARVLSVRFSIIVGHCTMKWGDQLHAFQKNYMVPILSDGRSYFCTSQKKNRLVTSVGWTGTKVFKRNKTNYYHGYWVLLNKEHW